MTRDRLPNRRAAMTVGIEHSGQQFTVTIGFYPDNRPGEVFTHGIKTGSALDALLADACVLLSVLLQHGVNATDLAASMGHLGAPGHPEVVAVIEDALIRIGRAGKPAGILTPDRVFAQRCLDLGALFVAVGVDAGILARATEALAREFKG